MNSQTGQLTRFEFCPSPYPGIDDATLTLAEFDPDQVRAFIMANQPEKDEFRSPLDKTPEQDDIAAQAEQAQQEAVASATSHGVPEAEDLRAMLTLDTDVIMRQQQAGELACTVNRLSRPRRLLWASIGGALLGGVVALAVPGFSHSHEYTATRHTSSGVIVEERGTALDDDKVAIPLASLAGAVGSWGAARRRKYANAHNEAVKRVGSANDKMMRIYA